MPEETTAEVENVDAAVPAPDTLPDDHPLVKALAAQKAEIKALKERARKLDEIEEAKKTDAEKASEALAAAEDRAVKAEAKIARLELAIKHHLTEDDAALLDGVTDPEALERIAERLAAEADGKPRPPRPDRNQGAAQNGKANVADIFAAHMQNLIH